MYPGDRRFLLFGAGARVCLGESLAKTELFLFLSHLLHQFTFKRCPDSPPPSLENQLEVLIYPKSYKVCICKETEGDCEDSHLTWRISLDSRFATFRSKLMFLNEIEGDWGTSLEGNKRMSTKENLKIVRLLKDVYLLHLLLWLKLVKMRYLTYE